MNGEMEISQSYIFTRIENTPAEIAKALAESDALYVILVNKSGAPLGVVARAHLDTAGPLDAQSWEALHPSRTLLLVDDRLSSIDALIDSQPADAPICALVLDYTRSGERFGVAGTETIRLLLRQGPAVHLLPLIRLAALLEIGPIIPPLPVKCVICGYANDVSNGTVEMECANPDPPLHALVFTQKEP